MYIYTISCPYTKNVVYVGKTNCFISRRYSHVSVKVPKADIERWVLKIIAAGNIPIIEILDIVDDKEGAYWEGFYMKLMRSWGFELLNINNSGKVRNYKNHTTLAAINHLGLSFREFCKIFFLDYYLLHNTLTMQGNFTFDQSFLINHIIKYAKNNPTVRDIQRDKRAKRKEQKKVANSRMSDICPI